MISTNFIIVKYKPLLPPNGDIIDLVSVMPLHVSLGLGLVNSNIIENLEIKRDMAIKEP